MRRLREIADQRAGLFEWDPLERIGVHLVSDADELWNFFVHTLPMVLASGFVKLVVVDSIAAVLRGEFAYNDEQAMANRCDWYFGLSNMLKMYSDAFGVMFVLANQVSADMKTGLLKPALGLAWSYCVNQRFVVHFDDENAGSAGACAENCHDNKQTVCAPRRRFVIVAFSPHRVDGALRTPCVVTKSGFVGVVER